MAARSEGVGGYVCTPHSKQTALLLENWKIDENIVDIYFATATFSDESIPYFPNKANNYLVASFKNMDKVLSDINRQDVDRLAFMFGMNSPLFERVGDRLNYISLYFTKYSNGDSALSDVANVIARRDRVKKASLAEMQLLTQERPKFTFPYAKNLVILEVEGSETHQTDQKYCERTRRDVARKGIMLNNLVSFSVLDKLK